MTNCGRNLPVRRNDFLSALGLARRAGRLVIGYDSVAEAQKLYAVYFASDFSPRAARRLAERAATSGAAVKTLPWDMAAVGAAIGKSPVGVVGVTDKGFAAMLDGKLQD